MKSTMFAILSRVARIRAQAAAQPLHGLQTPLFRREQDDAVQGGNIDSLRKPMARDQAFEVTPQKPLESFGLLS